MVRSKQAQIERGLVLIMVLMLNCGAAFAQAPPTATEVFNLRIRCKEMADKKAENFFLGTQDSIKFVSWSSKYDIKSNRCYIGLLVQNSYPKIPMEREQRQVYDGATDDLVAFAKIENGKKVGMVFDTGHRKTTDENIGWNDAIDYMDELMADRRN